MESVRAILQIRLSSSRLPCKGLLPIAGIPASVLAAKRAANTGLDIRVATSVHEEDDLLCNMLDDNNIPYVRGSLENVLERFLFALQDMDDSDIAVRLTGDNLFVDGAFINQCVFDFTQKEARFLTTMGGPDVGLPYGMSVEVFRVGDLRKISECSPDEHCKEHVTPYLYKKREEVMFPFFEITDTMKDWSKLRCTMDTLQDYVHIFKIFRDVQNPITVSWKTLCQKLTTI